MILDMSFKHMMASEDIKRFTEEKCEKLKKYFNGKIHVTWNFTVENVEKVAHVHLVGNHMDYFGEGRTEEFYASIDAAIAKIEKQIRKHKEIVKDHLHKTARVE